MKRYPRTEVNIVDNSFVTLEPVDTELSMFSPVFSEKGVDNKLQTVTSSEEFLSKLGKLNFRKYGQLGHNVMNWVQSGGGAYVLRLLPEDATYAHSILNIQTKTNKKEVLDYKGEKVNIDNVTMRPVSMHLKNANSMEAINNSLRVKYDRTVDGFENNPFMALVVEGRGRYYNRYGYRINILNEYDSTYDFRTYSFETLYTDERGVTSVIEGPFVFSFEPTAVNISNKSLFLPNVLDQYSDVFSAIINEDSYYNLLDTINSSKNLPNGSIDILSGATRMVDDSPETYLDEITGKEEDVHISLHEYNSEGSPVELSDGMVKLNIVNTSSEIQQTILEIDDTRRDVEHMAALKSVEAMKFALSRYRSGNYSNLVRSLADFDEDQNLNGGKLKYALDKYNKAFENMVEAGKAFEEDPSSENYEKILKVNDIAKDRVIDLRDISLEVTSTARAIGATPNLLEAIIEIKTANQLLGLNDSVTFGAANKIERILELQELVSEVRLSPTSKVKIEAVEEVLLEADEIIRFAVSMDIEDELSADALIELSKEQREIAFNAYRDSVDEYILPSELEKLVKVALNESEKYLKLLRETIDMVLVENATHTLKEVDVRINKLVIETVQAIKDSERMAETSFDDREQRENMINNIKSNIDKEYNTVKDLDGFRYKQVLKFLATDSVYLLGGSEGSLESENMGTVESTKKRLLMEAYKGQIDPVITDKEIVEYDIVIDGNLDPDIKSAVNTLVNDIRDDVCAIMDLNLTSSPQNALDARKNFVNYDSNRIFIYSQPLTVFDESSNSDIMVTTPYFLASKLPNNVASYGMHQPFAGQRRGSIDGYKSLEWIPTNEWKNKLYNNQVNYIEVKPDSVSLGTQLTSQKAKSALSNINNILTLLRFKRRLEKVLDKHRMELVDSEYLSRLNGALSDLTGSELDTGAYKDIQATAFANEYDLANNIYRVRYVVRFKDIVETILGTIEVEN